MKIIKRWLLAPDFAKLYGQPVGVKIKALWRKGWLEIPVIMAATPLAITGLIIAAGVALKIKERIDSNYQTKYRKRMTIYRPNDPRVAYINHYSALD